MSEPDYLIGQFYANYKRHAFVKQAEGGHRSICSSAFPLPSYDTLFGESTNRRGHNKALEELQRHQGCLNCISKLEGLVNDHQANTEPECTCETYGTCDACRPTHALRRHGKYRYLQCTWCTEWFYAEDMFIVGNYLDGRKVCGPDCPERPEREAELKKYKVVVRQKYDVEAQSAFAARNDARNLARRTGGIIISVWAERKR